MAVIMLVVAVLLIVMNFASFVFKKIAKLYCTDHKNERHLIEELKTVFNELKTTSMVDEFSKHAKLQRRRTKLQEELRKCQKMSSGKISALAFGFSRLVRIIGGVILLVIMYYYKAEPIIRLKPDSLFPFSYYLSWPLNQPGAVTVWAWSAICATATKALERKLAAKYP
ncbi:guided entry of tail-anchored proteins factor 1-like [Artemia franciscana]|uniref:guided entry of tail-anchored proteins factor 1-like n=1 Tax=Artemia franciscana TaxID=6661 RepID=UPI0032DB0D88